MALFEAINEVTADDAAYIRSGLDPANDIARVGLSDPSGTVDTSRDITVRYRYRKEGAGALDLVVRLKEGSTVRASWTHTGIAGTFADAAQALDAGQKSAITDWSNLALEFDANVTSGSAYGIVSWAEVEYQITVTAEASITLAPATVAAVGAFTVGADLAATLGAATLSADASVSVAADAAVTLAPVTLLSDAAVTVAAELGVTLAPVTLESAAGSPATNADLDVVLDGLALASDAVVAVAGDAVILLDAASLSSNAVAIVQGDLSAVLDAVTLSASAAGQNISAAGTVIVGRPSSITIPGAPRAVAIIGDPA